MPGAITSPTNIQKLSVLFPKGSGRQRMENSLTSSGYLSTIAFDLVEGIFEKARQPFQTLQFLLELYGSSKLQKCMALKIGPRE